MILVALSTSEQIEALELDVIVHLFLAPLSLWLSLFLSAGVRVGFRVTHAQERLWRLRHDRARLHGDSRTRL